MQAGSAVEGGVVSETWSGIPSDRVVAVVASLDTGRVQVGSGYLVTERLVLTARHCTADIRNGRPARELRVGRRSGGQEAPAALLAAVSGLDVAVLAVGGPPWELPVTSEPPRFGRVDRSVSHELRDCQAVGFPLWQLDPWDQGRNAAELHGPIRVTEDVESGFLVMRDPELADVGVPSSAGVEDRAGRSPWGGLSGAMVFYRGMALGVVVEHHPRQGRSAMRILPVERFAHDSRDDSGKAAVAAALGLPPAQQLPVVQQSLREDVAAYLRTLIGRLDEDPWPRDRQFEGPRLTPAVIERELQIAVGEGAGQQTANADDLAQRCQRLVILGGPGSGKTWLAKRTARRSAEAALAALAAGGALEEVELPLYTTCSGLLEARGDIRQAAVSSALDQLADLGGPWRKSPLWEFFANRDEPTLLVADSLDEANGADKRLQLADKLPWRIVITSRPGSWNRQLQIESRNGSHQVGRLEPLRYPEDVELVIRRWFAGRPERGDDLAGQLVQRPELQKLATVPLILAFYCILGGREPLPAFRHELYTRVVNRMLTGRWRGRDDLVPDEADACLQLLGTWAWSAAINHRLSGVATWSEEISVSSCGLGQASKDAIDHIALPLGAPDLDTRKVPRRFIHTSIREHLVAGHVATLSVEQAAEALFPHLWYDPQWEYAAPAAIAMHPQRDQLLRTLIRRAVRKRRLPANLSVIDAGWEFRSLLARVASETSQADWTPELAAVIGRCRVELAVAGRLENPASAATWVTSNRQIRDTLLWQLTSQPGALVTWGMVSGLVKLSMTEHDRQQAFTALLTRVSEDRVWGAHALVDGVVQLAVTADDKRQARAALLRSLNGQTWDTDALFLVDGLDQLGATADDKLRASRALLKILANPRAIIRGEGLLLGYAVGLPETTDDKRQVREILIQMITDMAASLPLASARVQLDPSLVTGLVQLDPTAEERQKIIELLLGRLDRQTDPEGIRELVSGLTELGLTTEERRQVREVLLRMLATRTDSPLASGLAEALAWVDPTAEDKRQVRQALLGLLTTKTDPWKAHRLVDSLARVDPTAEDKRQVRHALLGLLPTSRARAGEAGKIESSFVILLVFLRARVCC